MPTSIDPEPADDEIECARCGAHFYYELTRCPNCGVNLYEPEDEDGQDDPKQFRVHTAPKRGLGTRLEDLVRRLAKKPYPVDELFGTAINQSELYNDLLIKVGGDWATVERLVDYEREQSPHGNRILWLKNAIQRWEQDNRGPSLL